MIVINLGLCCSVMPVNAVQSLYLSAYYDTHINQIHKDFLDVLPHTHAIIYTRVPRGLILSVAEEEIFNPSSYLIKKSGTQILNPIISVLQKYKNNCVVESHTDENISANNLYSEDWEISIARANAIADYLVKVGQIPSDRIFPLGFGEMMPLKENVSKQGFRDRRIDFVIFDYHVTR